jgi:hypothetical protein
MSITKKPLIGLLVIFALVLISIPFQNKIDEAHGKFGSMEDSLYISSSMLDKISIGYQEILADLYWLRALQYFGGKNIADQNPDLLYHYFDIITDLDPKFINAYRYGGAFLAEPPPYGLGELELGAKLFNKGRENNPDNFRLPLEEAFLYYLYPKDYARAAELFEEAGSKPELSGMRKATIEGMAAAAHAQGGNREVSRKIWQIIYETNSSEGRRNFALRNLKEIRTMDIEDNLTLALKEYRKRFNKFPEGVQEIADTGVIKEIPASPLEGEFIIAAQIEAVKDSVLAKRNLDQNLRFLNAKSKRYNSLFGKLPENFNVLKDFIQNQTTSAFPVHPLGEEYVYNPITGKVTSGDISE